MKTQISRAMSRIRFATQFVVLASAVAVAAPAAAQAPLGFDDIETNATGYNTTPLASYNGYSFFSFGVIDGASESLNIGTGSNAVSGTKFAYGQAFGSSSILRDDIGFNFFGASLSFRQFDVTDPDNSPVSVQVLGYQGLNAQPTYMQTVLLGNTAQLFAFDFRNISELVFVTSALQEDGRSAVLALDNAQLAIVPEPSTVILLGAGLAGMLFVGSRRRRTS